MRTIFHVLPAVIAVTMLACYRSAPVARVESGLEVLMADSLEHLRDKRVGIVTNQTGVDGHGDHVPDLLHQADDVIVAALFGPEHGIRGNREGGKHITADTDPEIGCPVYSLYGKTRKPTPDMLEGLDVLIFDIQDIGARFYTYISTMSLALEAAAEKGIPFIVLDRPNPIGGLHVEGPVLDPAFKSFVGIQPIPVRHGMTVGELAQMFNNEGWLKGGIRADLTVIPARGWKRSMWHDSLGWPWVKPSPNMPNLAAATLYTGLCFLETTIVSEGRGTKTPFEIMGAPWIEPDTLMAALDRYSPVGIRYTSTSFTPVDMPDAAMNPKFEGKECFGLRFELTEPADFAAVDFGIILVGVLRRLWPQHFGWRSERGMDRLSGTDWIRKEIDRGTDPADIVRRWQPELARFKKMREKYLLYD